MREGKRNGRDEKEGGKGRVQKRKGEKCEIDRKWNEVRGREREREVRVREGKK